MMICYYNFSDIKFVHQFIISQMLGQTKQLSLLMVGRIYEEDQVFKLIEQAVDIVNNSTKALFYFTDNRTLKKILASRPKLASAQFIPLQHHDKINYVVTIGGDGTILYAAKQFKTVIPPIITFQRGSLGFMCRFALPQMEDVLNRLIHYHHKEIERPFEEAHLMRLQVKKNNLREEVQSTCLKVCINQVYISRRSHERITLEINVNGELLTRTAGDGILISTPTGSTAYSLSAGGPILQNGVNGILIVPISPNSLSFRPLCLPSTAVIKVKLHESSRSEAYASFDGQSIQDFGFVHEITIQRSANDVIFFENKQGKSQLPSWIQRLKYFLGWNQKYKAPIIFYQAEKISHVQSCDDID